MSDLVSDLVSDLARDIRRCTAQIVVDAAINEALTLQNQRAFDEKAEPWCEDRVAREFGADALDHFRAIRKHKMALVKIITKEALE